jgi:transcriptional regulator with XRE-family HTH domain
VEEIGERLRALRQKWGLSLREVEERSARLAQKWGNPSYRISASWLDRIERESRHLAAAKLIVLAVVYCISLDELLALFSHKRDVLVQCEPLFQPNSTLLLTNGPLEEHAKLWLPESIAIGTAPAETHLLAPEDHLPGHFRRGIIGRRDKTMDPMIKPGTIVLINTQRRAIAHRRQWTNEFDRPIYFFLTRTGYVCGWCELDSSSEWLTLVPHTLSYTSGQRWRYRKEVDVVGRVAAVFLRLEEAISGC